MISMKLRIINLLLSVDYLYLLKAQVRTTKVQKCQTIQLTSVDYFAESPVENKGCSPNDVPYFKSPAPGTEHQITWTKPWIHLVPGMRPHIPVHRDGRHRTGGSSHC